MSLSTTLSKLSRLTLLSLFCAGLFVSVGDLRVGSGGVEIGGGGVESVMAADPTPPAQPEDATINSIISLLNLGIGVLTFLITPLIMLAGWLLSPDWTFGEIFGLRPILNQLWVLVSNVVYVIFGFMLVFIAFANIFGGEHAKAYEMKTMLPKLVTGMLMVPFTWFIVSAVLSVSNLLTASVISLPMETILKSGGDTAGLLTDKIIPKNIVFNKNIDYGTGNTTLSAVKSKEVGGDYKADDLGVVTNGNFYTSDCKTSPQSCLSIKEFLTGGGGGAYNLLSVYAYGIFKIQDYKAITLGQKVNKVIDIAMKLGFGTIFFIIFGILVIAIVYALFSRAVMLWLYAMFSPFFALNYVLGDKAKKLEKFTIKEFISLALVPVYVSAALAFGLMFLGLVMGSTNKGTTGTPGVVKGEVVSITPEGKDATIFKFGNNDTAITFKTIGILDSETKSGVSSVLDTGKGVIGTIIMNVLALAILWMAVMAALGASKITEAAVAPIKGFGDEIGKLALKAPQYIPIPLPKGADGKERSISMAGMNSVGTTISSALNQRATTQGSELGQSFAKAAGIEVGELTKALQQATDKLKGKSDLRSQKEVWGDILGKIGDVKTLNANKSELTTKFQTMLDATKQLTDDQRTELNGNLKTGDLEGFIKNFEHTLEKNGVGGLSHVNSANTNEYLQSIKNGAQAQNTIKDINISKPSVDGKRTIEVILNLNNKDGKLELKTKADSTLDKNNVVDAIKKAYRDLHKNELETTEAEKLADEVIKKTKDSIPPKTP